MNPFSIHVYEAKRVAAFLKTSLRKTLTWGKELKQENHWEMELEILEVSSKSLSHLWISNL